MALFLRPHPQDIMGDDWSGKIRKVWDRMKDADSNLTCKPHAYSLWQWSMCRLSGMEHRIVASPTACAIAASANGKAQPDTELLRPLLALSDKVLQEMFG